jgi:hypothetical protein
VFFSTVSMTKIFCLLSLVLGNSQTSLARLDGLRISAADLSGTQTVTQQ